MAKTKISEFDSTPANNTDIDSINIAEGCAPSGINNAIRELMSQLKDQQTGASGDGFTVAGTLAVTGGLTLDGSAGTSGQVLTSLGTGTPVWTDGFKAGMIMLWAGTIATIPSGWVLCNGSNSTPDLRDRFVIGATQDESSVAKTNVTGALTTTGGTKDAVIVNHKHEYSTLTGGNGVLGGTDFALALFQTGDPIGGESGTNKNLPPYYALAYIMKT